MARCSFCGEDELKRDFVITAQLDNAGICNVCVAECVRILSKQLDFKVSVFLTQCLKDKYKDIQKLLRLVDFAYKKMSAQGK